MVSDITERKRTEIALKHQALHDPLTGLANRAMFDQQFAHILMTAQSGGSEVGLLLIDLDHFKEVNDNFGHPIGDELLIETAGRIEATKRQGDLVARLGGDEFALVMAGEASKGRRLRSPNAFSIASRGHFEPAPSRCCRPPVSVWH